LSKQFGEQLRTAEALISEGAAMFDEPAEPDSEDAFEEVLL